MADHSEAKQAQKRLVEAANALQRLVPQVAVSRQIKEFASDRRKNLLARWTRNAICGDKTLSATMAEAIARANPQFQVEFEQQEKDYREAELSLAKWEATKATFEAARSLNSFNKERLSNIPE